MRRGTVVIALCLALGSIGPAWGDDLIDAVDCAHSPQGARVDSGQSPSGMDLRNAICVSDGDAWNGAELYIGGEVLSDSSGLFCGAIVIGGFTFYGDPAWAHQGHCD